MWKGKDSYYTAEAATISCIWELGISCLVQGLPSETKADGKKSRCSGTYAITFLPKKVWKSQQGRAPGYCSEGRGLLHPVWRQGKANPPQGSSDDPRRRWANTQWEEVRQRTCVKEKGSEGENEKRTERDLHMKTEEASPQKASAWEEQFQEGTESRGGEEWADAWGRLKCWWGASGGQPRMRAVLPTGQLWPAGKVTNANSGAPDHTYCIGISEGVTQISGLQARSSGDCDARKTWNLTNLQKL